MGNYVGKEILVHSTSVKLEYTHWVKKKVRAKTTLMYPLWRHITFGFILKFEMSILLVESWYFPLIWKSLFTLLSVKQETELYPNRRSWWYSRPLGGGYKKSYASDWKIKYQLFPWDTVYHVENCWLQAVHCTSDEKRQTTKLTASVLLFFFFFSNCSLWGMRFS